MFSSHQSMDGSFDKWLLDQVIHGRMLMCIHTRQISCMHACGYANGIVYTGAVHQFFRVAFLKTHVVYLIQETCIQTGRLDCHSMTAMRGPADPATLRQLVRVCVWPLHGHAALSVCVREIESVCVCECMCLCMCVCSCMCL